MPRRFIKKENFNGDVAPLQVHLPTDSIKRKRDLKTEVITKIMKEDSK